MPNQVKQLSEYKKAQIQALTKQEQIDVQDLKCIFLPTEPKLNISQLQFLSRRDGCSTLPWTGGFKLKACSLVFQLVQSFMIIMIYSFGELFHQYLYIYTVKVYIHIHIVFVPSSVSLCSPCIAFGRHATGFDAKVLQCSWVAFEKVSRPSVSRRSRLGLVLGKANFK